MGSGAMSRLKTLTSVIGGVKKTLETNRFPGSVPSLRKRHWKLSKDGVAYVANTFNGHSWAGEPYSLYPQFLSCSLACTSMATHDASSRGLSHCDAVDSVTAKKQNIRAGIV